MLPHEAAVEESLAKRFRQLFQVAHDVHALAIKRFESESIEFTIRRGLDRPTHHTALALHVKALKQHRAIQSLAEKGLGQDALAVSRNLFETMLAIRFLLKHRIKLRNAEGKAIGEIKGKPLTTRFRARLYYSNTILETERMKAEFAKAPNLKRHSDDVGPTLAVDLKTVERLIGPEWTGRLRGSKTYCGVSLKDLSVTFGFGELYATHYRVSSWAVHASRIDSYITLDGQGGAILQLFPDGAYVREAMHAANVFLLVCIDSLNSRMELGLEDEIRATKAAITASNRDE